MRTFTTILSAGALTLAAATAQAGGLAPEIMERPEVQEDTVVAGGSSIPPTYIVLGILAALLIAAAVNADSDDSPTAATAEVEPETDRPSEELSLRE